MPKYDNNRGTSPSAPQYDNRLLPSPEAAAYTGRSVNFVRRVLRYEVPVVQHGTRGPMCFWSQDLDRWLAKHTQEPVS